MLFRNLRPYQFTGRGRPRTARLAEQLAPHRHLPCRPQQPSSVGWVAPDGSDDGPLVVELGDSQLLCLCVEQRVVPPAVLRREVQARAAALAQREGRPAGRREREALRDAVLAELRPRAFSRVQRLPVLIDAARGQVLSSAVGAAGADLLMEAVRNALGSLPLRLPEPGKPLPGLMTRWLRDGRVPRGLEVGGACALRDARDRQRVVRIRGTAELAGDVSGHIADGLEVIELELRWAERLSFRLREDGTLRSLRLLQDESAESDAADGDDGFLADALLESAALSALAARIAELCA